MTKLLAVLLLSLSALAHGQTQLNVQAFGAKCDDSTDDAVAIQKAVDSVGDTTATSRSGIDVLIPGPCAIGSTITIQRKAIRLVGLGWGNRDDTKTFPLRRQSYLRWIGSAGSPMVKVIDAWGGAGVFRLKFMGNTAAKPSAAIELNNTNTGVAQNQVRIEQVYIGGFSGETGAGTQFTDGIIFTGTNNNSEHRLDQVFITGCSGYGIRQGNNQQVNFLINHLTVGFCGVGVKLIAQIVGSSWNMSHNTVDIEIPALDDVGGAVNAFASIDNYYSEGAGRMLNLPSFSGYRLVINGGQFQITSSLNADGKIVFDEANTAGALVLRDFRFTQASAPPAAPLISMRSAGGGAAQRHIVLDNITGWGFLTGGTNGLNVATRGPTDRTYIYFLENAQAASAVAPRLAQNFVSGAAVDWNINRFDSSSPLLITTGATANQIRTAQTTAPTCTANCGTSPTVAGTDTAGIVTMGSAGVPASGWVVTFNGTWAAAPSCMVAPALAGMATGKKPIVVATTTTTMTVTTDGTAPATSDKYAYNCIGVQ